MKRTISPTLMFIFGAVIAAGYGTGLHYLKDLTVEWSMIPPTVAAFIASTTPPPLVQELPAKEPVHILFVGDIMLDRGTARHASTHGDDSLLKNVPGLIGSADLTIANLEGTVSGQPSIALQDSSILRFTFDARFSAWLHAAGFTAVSLANNHALDFGASGFTETVGRLTDAGVASFGHPLNVGQLSTLVPVKDETVCVVGFHSLYTPSSSSTISHVREIRPECSFLIVFPHWGIEYDHIASASQQKYAHAFIDAGADAVIGAHPHVVQQIEIYNDKPIFYSLGNFIFDQDFSPDTGRGLAVRIAVGEDDIEYSLIPVSIARAEASFANASSAEQTIADATSRSLPEDIRSSIRERASFVVPR